MPISAYYGGHGKEVMSSMRKTYPTEAKAEEVFYATANKNNQNPGDKKESGVKSAMKRVMRKKEKK